MTRAKFMWKYLFILVPAGIAFLLIAAGLNTGCRTAQIKKNQGVELLLVRDGEPAATILIDKEANRAARFAAAELQHHIGKISGAKLPITADESEVQGVRILVGESAATRSLGLCNADFAHQEYLIKFLPDTLVLIGRDKEDKRGMDYADHTTFPGPDLESIDRSSRDGAEPGGEEATCYAVYDFLERYCGVRWYLPTDMGLACPAAKTLAIKGADIRRAPAMKFRAISRGSEMPADLGDEGGSLLAARERALYLHRQRLVGVQPYACSHAFYGYYKLHLRDHPEWFAKGYDQNMPAELRGRLDGKDPVNPLEGHWGKWLIYKPFYPNMCYTDPGFISNVVNRARSFFDTGIREPGEKAAGDYFALEPLDSQERYCKCPDCAALLHGTPPCDAWRKHSVWVGNDSASDYVFDFVNKVARETGKTHPDKYLTKLAYSQAWYPPTRAPLEPNIAIQVAVFTHLRAVPAMDMQVIEFLDKWDEATRAGNNPKYLWLHCHRPGRVSSTSFPGFTARLMVEQMKDYHRRGYRGIYAEPAFIDPRVKKPEEMPAYRCPAVNMLEMYLLFKLAYDETLDGNQLIDEFFPLFYGAAGKPMQQLYEAIERVYCDPANYAFNPRYFGYPSAGIAWGKFGTAERMAEFGKLMEEAGNAAQTEMEKKRVALFEKNIWNRMQAGRKEYEDRQKQKAGAQLTGITGIPEIQASAPQIAGPNARKNACAARLSGATPDGDPDKVNWAQTPQSAILDNFGTLDGKSSDRRLEGRLLHDGAFLYVQLLEIMDTSKLIIHGDDNIWNEDDWELFVAHERGPVYRQIGINAKGAYKALAYGEKNKEWDSSVRVVSIGNADCWVVRMAFPLKKLLPGGVEPGQAIYLNICRGSAKREADLSWNPTFAGFQAPSQMGAIRLE